MFWYPCRKKPWIPSFIWESYLIPRMFGIWVCETPSAAFVPMKFHCLLDLVAQFGWLVAHPNDQMTTRIITITKIIGGLQISGNLEILIILKGLQSLTSLLGLLGRVWTTQRICQKDYYLLCPKHSSLLLMYLTKLCSFRGGTFISFQISTKTKHWCCSGKRKAFSLALHVGSCGYGVL